MDLDRQGIERRDFPIARRGYEPAAVDAHLSALASEVQALREALDRSAGGSLAHAAGSQVQGILQAAEATAADILSESQLSAQQAVEEASRGADQTRSQAIAQAQAHVSAVGSTSASLLANVEALASEVGALLGAVRAAAGRMSEDLASLEGGMAQLYDAAATASIGQAAELHAVDPSGAAAPPPSRAPLHAGLADPVGVPVEADPETEMAPGATAPTLRSEPPVVLAGHAAADAGSVQHGGEDLDGARLIALNMALNGDSREDTSRYLDEHFQLVDRQGLVNEVYAAIEG